jgi:hypothetical protein
MMYFKYKEELLKGLSVNLLTDNIKVALLKPSYIYNAAHRYLSDVVAEECVASGYTAGGILLANKSLTPDGNKIIFRANNPIWNIASGNLSSKYALVYKDTGAAATSVLIDLKDFYQTRVAINNSFTVEFNASGIFAMQ